MRLTIDALPGYLRMVVSGKETSQDARAAADSVFAEQARTGLKNILIVVRQSRPIFKVEQYGLSELIGHASGIAGLRVALVSDTKELYASHQYVELLAKQRGIEVRLFRAEANALKWLLGEASAS